MAQTSRHVHVLVRAAGLADSMSRYLVRRIEESPAITLHTETEIVALDGTHHLERVTWRERRTTPVTLPIRHVFSMTGASPGTAWLEGCLALDAKGFIKNGRGPLGVRPRARGVAARAAAPSARDQPPGRLRQPADVRSGSL